MIGSRKTQKLFHLLAFCLPLMACQSLSDKDGSRTSSTLSVQDLNHTWIRSEWEGWGTSLAWWGKGLGGTSYEDLYADIIFSDKKVKFRDQELPGLNMNIARYNIGGGGWAHDAHDETEKLSAEQPWFKDIDGFWINWYNKDPNSESFKWDRDPEQRSMLRAAIARGANHIEFFSNAPMWWMMSTKSAAGGNLREWNQRDFAAYLAKTVQQAKQRWNITATSIEPFNEPSAGWWNFPKNQEGANISRKEQKIVIGYLREELDNRQLSTPIVAADENTMVQALETYEDYKKSNVKVNGSNKKVADLIEKVNVHSYSGLDAWRDNGARQKLRASLGKKRLWVSEYGDGDGGGAVLAQTIIEDLSYLRPNAWVYWQVIEPHSAWGLINADFGSGTNDTSRGKPIWTYNKYYVMAHFSRYIRAGMKILENNDPWSVVAYDAATRTVNIVTVNLEGAPRTLDWNLAAMEPKSTATVQIVRTKFDSSGAWQEEQSTLQGDHLKLETQSASITSISVKLD